MTQDQLNLFAEEADSFENEILKSTSAPRAIQFQFQRWSYFRNGIMASYHDKKWKQLWTQALSPKPKGSCDCLEFAKSGSCTHSKELALWAQQEFQLEQLNLGEMFTQSQWIGLGQKWFQDWGPLHAKVKLPSVLQLIDGSGRLRVELKSKTLGQVLFQDFYGLLVHLDSESLRRLRVQEEISPMDWENFYHQNLDSTELNLKAQGMSTIAMQFDNSILGALMRHSFVFFEGPEYNPVHLKLEKDGLSINFEP